MKKKNNHADLFADLRQRAEETLREQPASPLALASLAEPPARHPQRGASDRATGQALDELSPAETQRLIHDLQVHQIELEMQNEELRQTQLELQASREKYLDLYDMAPVGYFTLNERGSILDANLTAARMLRVARGRLIGQPLAHFIVKADQDIYYHHRRELFESGAPQACDVRLLKEDGSQFYARLEAIAAQGVDGALTCRATVSDVSARVQMEERVKSALGEKEVLLREVHHRVKNNLRVLINLIDLQIKKVQEPQALQALAAFQGQIRAIAMVYEKLYQVQDLGRVDFGEYLKDLVTHLRRALASEQDVALRIEAEDVFINVNVAIPCGLMVNELVTNALKYAFLASPDLRSSPPPASDSSRVAQQRREGREGGPGIWVEFGEQDGEYVLVVGDNGVGLPAGLDWRAADTLGLKLVNLWATYQLGGSLEAESWPFDGDGRKNGTTFTVRFPKRDML